MSNQRIVLATFCDDIRYELGNKYSIMGCYKQDLVVSRLPATLPKLCAVVLVLTPIDQPFEKLTICARLDDEIVGELELRDDQLQAIKSGMLSQAASGMKKLELSCHLTFSPVVITQEGKLQVEAVSEDDVIKGSILIIRQRTQEDLAASSNDE